MSCSEEDDNIINSEDRINSEDMMNPEGESIILTDDSSETCANSAVFDPDFTGTACCTQRNSELTIGDTIEYEYFTNLIHTNVSWEVHSGDMEIISGSNASVVKVRLGDSFTQGEIRVLGKGICVESDDVDCACGHPIKITSKTKQ